MASSVQHIDIPIIDGREETRHCCDMLLGVLTGYQGVVGAHLDTNAHTLTLDYHPGQIGLKRVTSLAEEIGVQLETYYEGCCFRMDMGGHCSGCGNQLENRLIKLPGVPAASVNTTAGVISVEYDPQETSRQDIEKTIVRLGYRIEEEEAKASPFSRERVEPVLVGITLLTLIGGVVARALGGPGWLVTSLAVLSYAAGGYYGLIEGIQALLRLQINVDLLMIVAAIGAALIGSWPEGATLLFLFSLSNLLQNYALDRSRQAIRELLDLRPATALVRRNGKEVEVAVESLQPGEIVIIKPGDSIPVDGTVARGESSVDQASITGESIPVEKRAGDTVFAGTVNQHGALEVRVDKEAADSTLAKIIQLVEEAQARRAPTQRFIDAFEQYYALAVIGAVALLIAIPVLLLNRPFQPTFYRAMVLLVVASPCALVISTPASILSAIADAARKGILFKGGAHLESAANIKVVAFDKTGTLTYGRPHVTDIVTLNGYGEDELLALAAAAEAFSEHPLAQAVVHAAEKRALDVAPADEFQAYPGLGIRAQVGEAALLVGSQRLMVQEGHDLPPALAEHLERLENEGKTVLLIRNDEWMGAIGVADEIRPDAGETIAKLKRLGVERIAMLTGDNERVARAIAGEVGVDEYHAALMPEDKVTVVKRLEETYGSIAMVGDGVNDAPALATATIGVAMGAAGTDVALETADVVLMADDLAKLPYAIALSKRARRIVWQNIAFSLSVIVLLIAGTFGINIPLPLGVVGHEGSTVLVVFNGLRLLAFGAGRYVA
jgi:Cd2+/Zn2+-exporting ATPase